MYIKFIEKIKRNYLAGIIRILNIITTKAYDGKRRIRTDKEIDLIRYLKKVAHSLAVVEYLDCHFYDKAWIEYENRVRELVLTGDPGEFLCWDVILKTIFVTNSPYLITELRQLRRGSDWTNRYKQAIKETSIGKPLRFFLYPQSSGNLIHHAYHLFKFEESTGIPVDTLNFIFEFGGGYGSLCRLFYNLGFKGKYLIFDLPLFCALQKYFLNCLGIPFYETDTFLSGLRGVTSISEIDSLQTILDSHVAGSRSLFIATWSISEAPLTLRKLIIPLIKNFSSYLIAYQRFFHGINNIQFFKDLKINLDNCRHVIQWQDWEILHIPNNYYLIGNTIPK